MANSASNIFNNMSGKNNKKDLALAEYKEEMSMTNSEKLKETFPTGVYMRSGTWMSMEYEEPTTKNDLGGVAVSRQAVLELVEDYNLSMGQVVRGIHALTPVTPQQWIPVKDGLPKKSEYGDVLVTFIPPAGALWATVMKAHYSDLMGIAKPCFHIGEVGKESFEDITPQVTAWMPLPKPYKESESEVEDGNIKNS